MNWTPGRLAYFALVVAYGVFALTAWVRGWTVIFWTLTVIQSATFAVGLATDGAVRDTPRNSPPP